MENNKKNILFLAFKNRASFIFAKPILLKLMKIENSDRNIITFGISPSLLLEYLSQKTLEEFRDNIKKGSFKVTLLLPGFKDIFVYIKNPKKLSKIIQIILIENFLLIFSIFSYFKFSGYFPTKLSYYKLVRKKIFTICLIAGTNHSSALFLLKKIFSTKNINYKFVWLPHAPYQGNIVTETPSFFINSKTKIDFWTPLPEEKLSRKVKNVSKFISGYPPFTFKEIQKQRNIIDKKPLKNYQSRNLIIILRKCEPSNLKAQEYTYDIHQTLELLKNLSQFVNENNFTDVTFCLHPSTIISLMDKLIKKFKWPKYSLNYDYFLSHANKNSLVIGSYTSVLLHSALVGLPTICLNDHIMKMMFFKQKHLYNLFESSPVFINNYDSKSLSELYLDIKLNYFQDFLLNPNQIVQNSNSKFYFIYLANKQFNKAIKRINDLQRKF